MSSSDSLTYRVATTSDCDSLASLVNSSYRGELARQGWTNENELVGGCRTNVDALSEMINITKSIILIFFDQTDGTLSGCVSLDHKPEIQTAYLGMLTVRPDLQRRGYGSLILSIGEKYAVDKWNVHYIEMTVVDQRTELMAYYNRRGYIDTGHRELFPLSEFGQPKRDDLYFCTLRKCLQMNKEKTSA